MNGKDFGALMEIWAQTMSRERDWLIQLDSVAGDSDLGLTMSDGFRAAADALQGEMPVDLGKAAYTAGKSLAAKVPSTMGTLMASGLMNAGKVLKGTETWDDRQEAAFFQAYFDGVQSRGKAQLGDKTFLDGLYPAVQILSQAETITADVARQAAQAAWQAFENTRGMIAKQGRMAIRGEQSRDMLDPGAAVAALLMKGYAQLKQTESDRK